MAVVALLLCGCVEREMTITSDPPGALVFVSRKPLGRTPLTQTFLWYGDYEITLRHQGYKTLKTHAKLKPPIYEIMPLDLISAIVPWTYHDRRYLHYELEKFEPTSDEDLIRRSDELREKNLQPVRK